jgi:serine/threonine protein kinase
MERELATLKKLAGLPGFQRLLYAGTEPVVEVLGIVTTPFGIDLARYRSLNGGMFVGDIVEVAHSVLSQLEILHLKLQLVHNDICPSNVILSLENDDRKAVIIDYGSACLIGDTDVDVYRHRDFMSIGAHRSEPPCCWDDVEALAYVLWFLLKVTLSFAFSAFGFWFLNVFPPFTSRATCRGLQRPSMTYWG